MSLLSSLFVAAGIICLLTAWHLVNAMQNRQEGGILTRGIISKLERASSQAVDRKQFESSSDQKQAQSKRT